MNNTSLAPQLQDKEPGSSSYASFVLRCWTGDEGQVRARLIDVHTGVAHLMLDLNELPTLVQQLVNETLTVKARPGHSAASANGQSPTDAHEGNRP